MRCDNNYFFPVFLCCARMGYPCAPNAPATLRECW